MLLRKYLSRVEIGCKKKNWCSRVVLQSIAPMMTIEIDVEVWQDVSLVTPFCLRRILGSSHTYVLQFIWYEKF